VGGLLKKSGLNQDLISRKMGEAVSAFGAHCSVDLPSSLSKSTISRMKTGSNIKKLKRQNLILLHLTIDYIRLPKERRGAAAARVAADAEAFADAVLHTGGAAEEEKEHFFKPSDPRHDRTASLFGDYGVGLLESAIGRSDADSYRKLASLQWLSGNTDDAHYWNKCADQVAPGAPEAIDTESAAQAAFCSGRLYLYKGQGDVAEIYLALAADAGHADSAFLLGDVLEALERDSEAFRWFSTAKSNGHREASARLASLKERTTEGRITTL
jgi:hypothetical protein